MSDKYITDHCGVLDHLVPGDIVLADRGFTICEQHTLMGVPQTGLNANKDMW